MQRLTNVKLSRLLLIACWLSYAVISCSKMCVPTVISAMVNEGFLNKSQSGLLSGLFYLFYGAGQLFFGKYFNNHSPFIGPKLAILGSGVCCYLMSLTNNFYLLLLFWSLCAVFNACFFPALMKIVSFNLKAEHSVWANNYMLIAQQLGTVICLIAGSIIMKYIGWIKLYYFAAIISVITFIFWCYAEVRAKKSLLEVAGEGNSAVEASVIKEESIKKPIIEYIGTGIFCVFTVSFLNSLIHGVKTWAPTIIMETYNTSPSFSVFLNIIIVASNILFLLFLGRFAPRNKIKSVITFCILTLPFVVLMNFTSIINEYIYVFLMGLLTSLATYITNVTAIQIPYYFDRFNDVARVCGISNMCSSMGVLLGNWLYGVFADLFGWQIIMIMCIVFVVLIIVLMTIADKGFKKFLKS